MRIPSYAIAFPIVVAALWCRLGVVFATARCTYMTTFPSAIGRNTFLLATATPGVVTASVDKPDFYRPRENPAQVMRIDDVAGFQAEIVRNGLRASGGTAVFIRYGMGPSCAPYPVRDGAFDSVGVSGLYAGRPRPADRWVNGRPTFDIFPAEQYPLPQRGHVMAAVHDSTSIMTSEELFAMYRSLWAESVTVGDRSVEQRIYACSVPGPPH